MANALILVAKNKTTFLLVYSLVGTKTTDLIRVNVYIVHINMMAHMNLQTLCIEYLYCIQYT